MHTMKRFFRRQSDLPQNDLAAADHQSDSLALAGAGELNRRRFTRALLLGRPAAGVAPAADGAQAAAAAATSDAWKLGGNSTGVIDGSLFLGTADATPLVLKTNKTERMRISQDGLVSIGTSPGGAQLFVASSRTHAMRAETTAANGVGLIGLASSSAGQAGVSGAHLGGGIGVVGRSDTSIGDSGNSIGVYGEANVTDSSAGVKGVSTSGYGVRGISTAKGGYGVHGEGAIAVSGKTNVRGGYGVRGEGSVGVWGKTEDAGGGGVVGLGYATDQLCYGIYGAASSSKGYAGYFEGRVHVVGNLSKTGGSFKIDHPLDPTNKYLSHSFVESPDMLNIYNGNVALDAHGTAVVELPAYFDALNMEFRYQLTAIGAPAPRLHIAEEIGGNRFKIAGGKAGMKVSWQVTGIRQDAWANAHRIPVEEDKPAQECGTYLSPVEHGHPEELGLYHHQMEELDPARGH
jgi:hypothetical protein